MFRARATESPLRVTTPTSDLSRQNSDHYRRPGQRSKTWTVGGTQRRPTGGAGVHPSDHPISKTISLALSATSSRCRRELGAARTRGYSANRRVGACPSSWRSTTPAVRSRSYKASTLSRVPRSAQ